MSINLTDAAVIEFDNEVKHEYQGQRTLRNSVTTRMNVTGESYKFTRMGKGLAQQKATQADVVPMDITHARQTATMQNWYAAEYTDIFDNQEVNFDERQELAKTIAKGIGRREDQLIIDAMLSGTITYAADQTNDSNPDTAYLIDEGDTTNFNMEILHKIKGHYMDIEADSEITVVLEADALQFLLSEEQVGSADYNTIKALVNGDLNQKFMGMNFRVIGTRAEGGLPGVTTEMIAYAYAQDAIGLAVGIDMKTTVDWVPEKTSWLCNGIYKAASVVREAQGIVQILYSEAKTT